MTIKQLSDWVVETRPTIKELVDECRRGGYDICMSNNTLGTAWTSRPIDTPSAVYILHFGNRYGVEAWDDPTTYTFEIRQISKRTADETILGGIIWQPNKQSGNESMMTHIAHVYS